LFEFAVPSDDAAMAAGEDDDGGGADDDDGATAMAEIERQATRARHRPTHPAPTSTTDARTRQLALDGEDLIRRGLGMVTAVRHYQQATAQRTSTSSRTTVVRLSDGQTVRYLDMLRSLYARHAVRFPPDAICTICVGPLVDCGYVPQPSHATVAEFVRSPPPFVAPSAGRLCRCTTVRLCRTCAEQLFATRNRAPCPQCSQPIVLDHLIAIPVPRPPLAPIPEVPEPSA
jgi:hypothetical protein